MAPAGGFWAVAGARVVFGCARGKSGEVMVLLGAKEEEKELGWGRNVGGGRSVDGGELGRARGGSGHLTRTMGEEGGGLGAGGARH